MSAEPRTVVVGGGVIGLAIAWRLATVGQAVTIVDPAPGRGASWVAGGMLAPVAEAYRGEEAITALGLASVRRWPGLVADLAAVARIDPGYSRQGTVVVARDADDAAHLQDLFALQRQAGLTAERLSSRDIRHLEPALAPSVRGGLWLADDHQIDNRLLLAALLVACERTGVDVVRADAAHITSHTVSIQPEDAPGARPAVVLEADVVIVATGARVPPIEVDGAPVTLPMRPVKGQIVRVRATDAAVFPRRTVRGLDAYVIPRASGEIAIGATSEEKGYDTTVTAGGVHQLLHDAWELVPALAEAEFVEAIAGSRPATPDNAPLIGRWGPDGPIIAMGHYRHGVLLMPATADAVVALVTGSPDPAAAALDAGHPPLEDLLGPFDPQRFAPAAPRLAQPVGGSVAGATDPPTRSGGSGAASMDRAGVAS